MSVKRTDRGLLSAFDTSVEGLPAIDLEAMIEPEPVPEEVAEWVGQKEMPSLELDAPAGVEGTRQADAYIYDQGQRWPLFIEQLGRNGMVGFVPGVQPSANYKVRFEPQGEMPGAVVGCRTTKTRPGFEGVLRWMAYTLAVADSEHDLLQVLVNRMFVGDLPSKAILRSASQCAYDFSKSRTRPIVQTLEQRLHHLLTVGHEADRREQERVKVRQEVSWCVGRLTYDGIARQISATGMRVQTWDAVPDEGDDVAVVYPIEAGHIYLHGRVVRVHSLGHRPDGQIVLGDDEQGPAACAGRLEEDAQHLLEDGVQHHLA